MSTTDPTNCPTLPVTGTGVGWLVAIAAGLVLLGLTALVIGRHRGRAGTVGIVIVGLLVFGATLLPGPGTTASAQPARCPSTTTPAPAPSPSPPPAR